MTSPDRPPNSLPRSDMGGNPYAGYGAVGFGMTGLILKIDEARVIKVAKVYPLDNYVGDSHENMEYVNNINIETLKHERSIYERLGPHRGIITCFKASDYRIELAYAKQGDLERYIENNPEPHELFKME
jgi:hypothetical protein